MTWEEFTLKWCPEFDASMERAHMALKESGCTSVGLGRFFYVCGHHHYMVGLKTGCDPVPDEAYIRAYRLVMPPEMFEEWVELWTNDRPETSHGQVVRD